MGFLNRSQMTKEDFLDSVTEENSEEDAHVGQDHETGIALGEVDTCRVKVGSLLECGKDNGGGKRGASCTVRGNTHLVLQLWSLEPCPIPRGSLG